MPEQVELKLLLYKTTGITARRGQELVQPPHYSTNSGFHRRLQSHKYFWLAWAWCNCHSKGSQEWLAKDLTAHFYSLDIRGHGSDYEMEGAGGDRQENNGQRYRHKVQRKVEKHWIKKKKKKLQTKQHWLLSYIPPAANLNPSQVQEMKSPKVIPVPAQRHSHNRMCGHSHSSHRTKTWRMLGFCFSSS